MGTALRPGQQHTSPTPPCASAASCCRNQMSTPLLSPHPSADPRRHWGGYALGASMRPSVRPHPRDGLAGAPRRRPARRARHAGCARAPGAPRVQLPRGTPQPLVPHDPAPALDVCHRRERRRCAPAPSPHPVLCAPALAHCAALRLPPGLVPVPVWEQGRGQLPVPPRQGVSGCRTATDQAGCALGRPPGSSSSAPARAWRREAASISRSSALLSFRPFFPLPCARDSRQESPRRRTSPSSHLTVRILANSGCASARVTKPSTSTASSGSCSA